MATVEPVIDVHELSMCYGPKTVLDRIDLRVERGEVMALLGPNGAGKTTTVEILEGFRVRSAGEVRVLGKDPTHGDDIWRARLGIVLQSWRDHSKWRVRELLDCQAQLYAPYTAGSTRGSWSTADLLAAVDLTGQADSRIRTLSGGQRRRLDLALGLVGRPQLLFLDEPTASLDPQARRDFHALVRRAVREIGTTILLTTHDLWEADELANRIAILVGGRIIAQGTRADLTNQITGTDCVRYTLNGTEHTESVSDSTGFVRDLFLRHGEAITGLEVHRASLEDTYLAYIRSAETEQTTPEPVA